MHDYERASAASKVFRRIADYSEHERPVWPLFFDVYIFIITGPIEFACNI